MRVSDSVLATEVESVSAQLQTLADGLAADGMVTASGVVLMGRQAIRALWTRLHPPAEAPPELTSVPPEAEPSPSTGEAAG